MPPSVLYRSLCISEISRNISDNSLKEEIFKKFEKFGDFFNIKVSFFNNQRVAYINFTYDEDARKAYQEYHSLHLFGRAVKIEPVPIKNSRRNRQESRSPPISPFYRRYIENSPSSYQQEARRPLRDNYYEYGAKDYFTDVPKNRYMDDPYDDEYSRLRKNKYNREEPFYPLDATRSLFVGNIPDDIEESEVYKIFKMFGPITDVDVKRAVKGKNNAYSFVKYFTLDFALRARDEMQGELIGNMPCKIGFGKPSPTKRLWIGGLGPWTTLGLLEREFDKFGPILKIDYLKGDTFAFIMYETIDSAEAAYHEMKGLYLLGENVPYSRIMTDFADTKHVFYDGTNATEFLETYHKPINYLPIIRKNVAAQRFERSSGSGLGAAADMHPSGGDYNDFEYRLSNKRSSGGRKMGGGPSTTRYDEREEGEMPDDEQQQQPFNNGSAPGGRAGQFNRARGGAGDGRPNNYSSGGRRRSAGGSSEGAGSPHLPKRKRQYNNEDEGEDPSDSRSRRNRNNEDNNNGAPPFRRQPRTAIHPDSRPPKTRRPRSDVSASSSHSAGGGPKADEASSSSHKSSQSPPPGRSVPRLPPPRSSSKIRNTDNNAANAKRRLIRNNKSQSSSSGGDEDANPATGPLSASAVLLVEKLNESETFEGLVKVLLEEHPSPNNTLVWSGDFSIKNSSFPLNLYHFPNKGDNAFFRKQILPALGTSSELQIVQRFRLDSAKIEDMSKLVNHRRNNSPGGGNAAGTSEEFPDIQYSVFLALDRLTKQDFSNNPDIKSQKRLLKDLIHYLRQKNAAGVIFLNNNSSSGVAGGTTSPPTPTADTTNNNIMYAFPPCEFTKQFFNSNFPQLNLGGPPGIGVGGAADSASSSQQEYNHVQNHLLIVILKGATKKKAVAAAHK